MAFTYKIEPNAGDSHQVSPYWFAAVIRLKEHETFDRSKLVSSPQNVSRISAQEAIAEVPGKILIIDGDVAGWNITSNKSSHVSNLTMTLSNSEVNYAYELVSGDWIGFWAFDNYEDFKLTRSIVSDSGKANGFRSGLKFLGRVETVRKDKSRNPIGQLYIMYSVTAVGFSELDSTIYYNPTIATKWAAEITFMEGMGSGINELLVAGGGGLIKSQEIIPKLFRILLGTGAENVNEEIEDPNVAPGSLQASPNREFLVPATIGKWFNRHGRPSAVTYADLMLLYIGIQKYEGVGVMHSTSPEQVEGLRGFLPSDIVSYKNNTLIMNENLSGDFHHTIAPFDGHPVWSILKTYINEPIDEMYTCLRVDPHGDIRPTLIVRQTPKSSKWFMNYAARNAASEINDAGGSRWARGTEYGPGEPELQLASNPKTVVTLFTELPRWEIHDSLVQHLNVGRSNLLRFNYIHFQGMDLVEGNSFANTSISYINSPPIVDSADISRSGLRMLSKPLSANVLGMTLDGTPGRKWQEIMADILMGGHLKYSGTLVSKGIQEPICQGDNLVVDGVIYHIEGVAHSGSISPDGMRDFTTTVQLSDGISIHNDFASSSDQVIYPDEVDGNRNGDDATIAKDE